MSRNIKITLKPIGTKFGSFKDAYKWSNQITWCEGAGLKMATIGENDVKIMNSCVVYISIILSPIALARLQLCKPLTFKL